MKLLDRQHLWKGEGTQFINEEHSPMLKTREKYKFEVLIKEY